MKTWIILPYDASPLAKAALSKAASEFREGRTARSAGVVLATAGIDPTQLDRLIEGAQVVAGADVPLEVRLLNAGDPIADLRTVAASMPDAVFAAPLAPSVAAGRTPWYAEACRSGGDDHSLLLFVVTSNDLRMFAKEESDDRHRVGGPLARVLRACTGLHLGMRAPVTREPA